MRPDLCSPRWKQTYSALGLSLPTSTRVVSYRGSAVMWHLVQLFEGLSPKISEKGIIKRKQNTHPPKKKKGRRKLSDCSRI